MRRLEGQHLTMSLKLRLKVGKSSPRTHRHYELRGRIIDDPVINACIE
jgi:hypothetical protein